MTNKEYEAAMRRIKYENSQQEMKENLKAAKYKNKKKAKMPTSKKVLWIVIIINVEIVIFSQILMWMTKDLSSLYSLVALPTTLIPTALGYFWKSSHDHRGPNGEGIDWQSMMNEQQNNFSNNYGNYSPTDDGSVG